MEIDSFFSDLYGLAKQGNILWGSDAQRENQHAKGAKFENLGAVSAPDKSRMQARQPNNPSYPGWLLLKSNNGHYHLLNYCNKLRDLL